MTANRLEGEDEKRERETIKMTAKAEENSYLVSGKSIVYWIFKLKKFTKLGMMVSRDEHDQKKLKTF